MVPATEWDAQLLRRVGVIVQELLDSGASNKDIVAAVEKEAPEVAKRLRGKTRKQLAWFAGGLAALGWMAADHTVGYGMEKGLDAVVDELMQRPPRRGGADGARSCRAPAEHRPWKSRDRRGEP